MLDCRAVDVDVDVVAIFPETDLQIDAVISLKFPGKTELTAGPIFAKICGVPVIKTAFRTGTILIFAYLGGRVKYGYAQRSENRLYDTDHAG